MSAFFASLRRSEMTALGREHFSTIVSYARNETARRMKMPIILWLLGVPVGLVIVLWLLHVI
jgi:hypothetical protein